MTEESKDPAVLAVSKAPSRYILTPRIRFKLRCDAVPFFFRQRNSLVRGQLTLEEFETLRLFMRARTIEEVIKDAPATSEREKISEWIRRGILTKWLDPTVCLHRPDCRQLFIMFYPGARLVADDDTSLYGITGEGGLLDRNIVMLSDSCFALSGTDASDAARDSYMSGVSKEIPDFASLVEWLRRYIAERRHITEVYCIGTSMSGLAAMLASHHLSVRTAFIFSPVSTPATLVGESPRNQPIDVREVLREHNGVTEYRVYYGQYNEIDLKVAKELSPLPGVKLYPVETDLHSTREVLIGQGLFKAIFPPFGDRV